MGSWVSSCSHWSLTHLLSRVGLLLDLQERGWACKGGGGPPSCLHPKSTVLLAWVLTTWWMSGCYWDKRITGASLKRAFQIKASWVGLVWLGKQNCWPEKSGKVGKTRLMDKLSLKWEGQQGQMGDNQSGIRWTVLDQVRAEDGPW